MNLLIGVVVVLVLIAVVAIGRRLIGSRSDEHAMETYEHALDVLGDASRRNDSRGVRIVPPDEVAKAHIRSTDDADLVPRPGAAADVPPPRIRLEPPVLPGVSPGDPPTFGTPRFGTPALPPAASAGDAGAAASRRTSAISSRRAAASAFAPAGEDVVAPASPGPAPEDAVEAEAAPAPAPAVSLDDDGDQKGEDGGDGAGDERVGPGSTPSRRQPGAPTSPRSGGRVRDRSRSVADPAHERRVRRAATGGMAVVAAAAVAVAALQLAGGPAKPSASKGSTPNQGSGPQGSGQGGSSTTTTAPLVTTTTTTVPSSIVPEAASATEVAYRAPATTYTVTFQASGPCWVGVQQTAGGPWVWEETIEPGQTQTYSASGSVVVRLGAPPKIRVSIDGITVQLPSSNVQPYNLTFTPDS